MAESVLRLRVDSSEYDSKIKRAAAGLTSLEEHVRKLGKDFTTASQNDIEFVKALGNMETVSRTSKGKLAELGNAIQDLSAHYKRLTAEEKSSPYGQALRASLDQLTDRYKGLKADIADVSRSMGDANTSAVNLGGGFKSAMGSIVGFSTAAGAAMLALNGVKKAVQYGIDVNMRFEQANADLAGVLGTTTDQIARLTESAKNLGATTRYTAIEISQLQTELAKLGFTQSEILSSTDAVQQFATATGADLAGSAALCGAALRAWGLDASEMERVASTLAVSTTKSALSYEKLSTSIATIAPIAHAFGFEIEDTVALLGQLADAGFDASTAATATRNIFLNLADSGGGLAKALGRSVNSLDDLAPAFAELKARGVDLATALELTDKRSVAAFETFLQGSDKVIALRDAITDCSAAMDDMGATRANTLQGSLTLLSSAWDGLMLNINNGNGILKESVDLLTNLINRINETSTLGGKRSTARASAGGDSRVQTEMSVTRSATDREATIAGIVSAYDEDIAAATAQLDAATEALRNADNALEADSYAKVAADMRQRIEGLQLLRDEYLAAVNDLQSAPAAAATTAAAAGASAPAGGKAAAATLPAAMGASYWDIYSQVMPEGGGLKGNGKVVDVPVIMDVEVEDDGVVDDLLDKMKEAEEHSANIAAKTNDWGDALSSVGSAFDGIGDAIGGTAGEYVSWIGSTVSALGELLSTEWAAMILSQGKLQFPLNVVAIASTIGAVTSAISSMPKFATGGIVPGNSYSGDHVPIFANSGELILNSAQQTNLASQLRGTSGSAAHTSVSGEQLVTVINAYGRRTGRGEILK